MIYECTDCQYCANFDFGFRVFCLHPDLPAEEVYKYFPVGNGDAEKCSGYDDNDESPFFGMMHLTEAEEYSIELFGEVTYDGIRAWCERQPEVIQHAKMWKR